MGTHVPLDTWAPFLAVVAFLYLLIVAGVAKAGVALDRPPDEGRRRIGRINTYLTVWTALTAGLAISGLLLNFQALPPRFLAVLLPPVVAVIWLVRTPFAADLIAGLSPSWFIMPQAFRIVVEFGLWRLYTTGDIPVQMTFEGRNFDILAGLTAPLVAWLCFQRRVLPAGVAVAWNLAGLALLANIVGIAILSAPTPFRVFLNDPPNTIIAYWPFVWLPAFIVPMALLLHLLSLRQLLSKQPAAA